MQYQYSQKVEQGKKFQRFKHSKNCEKLTKVFGGEGKQTLQKADLSWNVKVISITKTYTRSNST